MSKAEIKTLNDKVVTVQNRLSDTSDQILDLENELKVFKTSVSKDIEKIIEGVERLASRVRFK
jgi:peptidoglycan hydrolase CwlO-like protein